MRAPPDSGRRDRVHRTCQPGVAHRSRCRRRDGGACPIARVNRRKAASQESIAGVDGLLNAFFVTARGTSLGWICIGTAEPSREALGVYGEPLTEIAHETARTLEHALDLAQACGAQVADAAETALAYRDGRSP